MRDALFIIHEKHGRSYLPVVPNATKYIHTFKG